MPDGGSRIDKLDYDDSDACKPLLHPSRSGRSSTQPSRDTSVAGSFFEHVAEGVQDQDRRKLKREVVRYGSFVFAILACACAGSITAFSLYGHLFQSRLHYTQSRVNIVSITAELALYLPVPILGYLVDRYGPGPMSLLSAILFGSGYFLGAFTYHSGPPRDAGGEGWPFAAMVLAFIGIGMGTVCMYLPAVTTCAKNFAKSKYKGFALAAPIAAFGLGGMWQSQVGSRLLYETNPDGSRGDVDVFRYFLFLGGLLFGLGAVGALALQLVDEDELIDEAVDYLERSGLLEDSEFFRRGSMANGYGTVDEPSRPPTASQVEQRKRKEVEEKRKKEWLLNEETRRFLSDHTMWWLAAGFFLVTGPGEAFINNLGTIIGTLYPRPPASTTAEEIRLLHTSPATHVSIVAITSTLARLLSGTLSDLLGPYSDGHQHRRGPESLVSSLASLDPLAASNPSISLRAERRFTVSRVALLLVATLLLSLGQLLLASGAIQGHGSSRFWAVSALVGTGYGAVFSLVPIIISCVWGVENFATNWGIVAVVPAAGAALWGGVYAKVYEWAAAERAPGDHDANGDAKCYGAACYRATFWAMTLCVWVACGMWLWAWRGPGGWRRRGVVV